MEGGVKQLVNTEGKLNWQLTMHLRFPQPKDLGGWSAYRGYEIVFQIETGKRKEQLQVT